MIYLLHSTTAPLDPRVRDVMQPAGLLSDAGMPRRIIEEAREKVSRFVVGGAGEIVFTSGGTESCNAALKGVAFARMAGKGERTRRRILVASTEHTAVLYPARTLGKMGFDTFELPVDRFGIIDEETLGEHLDEETLLVSVALANGETGTVHPVREIARRVHEAGGLFHTDACLAASGMRIDLADLGVDLASFSAHKLGGPRGTGALYVRKGVRVQTLIEGGVNEGGRRGGMENLAGIAGFGEAVSLLTREPEQHTSIDQMGDDLLEALTRVPGVGLNGHPTSRLRRIVNVSVEGVDGEALLNRLALRDIAASSGSSCFQESGKPSHVLMAMDAGEERAGSSLVFSLGPGNNRQEITQAAEVFAEAVESLRAIAIPDTR